MADTQKATMTGRKLHGKVEVRGGQEETITSQQEDATRKESMPTRSRKQTDKIVREYEREAPKQESPKDEEQP